MREMDRLPDQLTHAKNPLPTVFCQEITLPRQRGTGVLSPEKLKQNISVTQRDSGPEKLTFQWKREDLFLHRWQDEYSYFDMYKMCFFFNIKDTVELFTEKLNSHQKPLQTFSLCTDHKSSNFSSKAGIWQVFWKKERGPIPQLCLAHQHILTFLLILDYFKNIPSTQWEFHTWTPQNVIRFRE